MESIKEIYSSLNPQQQLFMIISLVMSPSFIVFILIKFTRLEKWKCKNEVIRLGVAFGLGAMLADFVLHISMDTFHDVLDIKTGDHHTHGG